MLAQLRITGQVAATEPYYWPSGVRVLLAHRSGAHTRTRTPSRCREGACLGRIETRTKNIRLKESVFGRINYVFFSPAWSAFQHIPEVVANFWRDKIHHVLPVARVGDVAVPPWDSSLHYGVSALDLRQPREGCLLSEIVLLVLPEIERVHYLLVLLVLRLHVLFNKRKD